MASKSASDQRVVTLNGIEGGLEASKIPTAKTKDDVDRALVLNRYAQILDKLRQETDRSDPDVFVEFPDRDVAMFQTWVAEHGSAKKDLAPGGKEVKFGKGLEDPLGWLNSLFDWVDRADAHHILRPTGFDPEPFTSNAVSIGLISDWGSGLYGAPVSAASIAAQGGFDLLVHLGDVYYSGTPEETRNRFLDPWPTTASSVSRALNGNHEMYSGGFGYFDGTLPEFGQTSSYFAMSTDHWLLVFLDSAYVDHALDAEQVEWINEVLTERGTRRLALFSHHQPFSRFNDRGSELRKALKKLLESGGVDVWYWGHEHECILYDAHPAWKMVGRCLGHGGVPEARRDQVKQAAAELDKGDGVTWKRIAADQKSPSCLVLDGPNPCIPSKKDKFSPHGYMTIELDDRSLTEHVHLPDSTEIWSKML